MNRKVSLVALLAILISSQLCLAQSADYYLERVAIHARLVQSKLGEPESVAIESGGASGSVVLQDSLIRGGVFREDLQRLLDHIEDWRQRLPSDETTDYDEVERGLEKQARLLKISVPSAELDINQRTSFELLLLEIEQASEQVGNEYRRISLDREERQSETALPRRVNAEVWGTMGRWGGWDGWGPWGPGCDPWGPYFGRPLNPSFDPYCNW